MTNSIRTLLLATALLGGASFQASQAADLYPRAVGTGENVEIEYGPGPQRNILGGGAVLVQDRAGNETVVTHLDDRFVQRPQDGLMPVLRSQGQNNDVVYIPYPAPAPRG